MKAISALSSRQKFSQKISHGIATNIIVQFLRYRELGIRGTNERNVRQSVDIRESARSRRLRHKLYKRLRNKLDNDNWPSLNNDIAEFTYRVL